MIDGMRQVLMHFGILWLDYANRCLERRNLREDTEYASWSADMKIELCNPFYVLHVADTSTFDHYIFLRSSG